MQSGLMSIIRYSCILITLFSLIGASCRQSLMYNPALNLPPKPPIKGGDYRIYGACGFYPEARPEKVGKTHQFGYGGGAMVSLTKEVSLNIMMCTDLDRNTFDFGAGLTFFSPTENGKKPFIFNLRLQKAIELNIYGEDQVGTGIAAQAGTYFYSSENSSLFIMTGFGYAYADSSYVQNDENQQNSQTTSGDGWLFLNNIGYTYEFSKKISSSLETSIIYQYISYDNIGRLVFSPNLCFMFRF